jgi:hypothetical protein
MPTDITDLSRMLQCATREVIAAHLECREVAPELVSEDLEEHLKLFVTAASNLDESGPVPPDVRNLAEAAIETLGLIQAHEKEMAYREFLRERSAALSAE